MYRVTNHENYTQAPILSIIFSFSYPKRVILRSSVIPSDSFAPPRDSLLLPLQLESDHDVACSLSACSDVCHRPSAWVAHALLWSHVAWAYFAHTFTRTARGNKRRLIQSDRRDGRALFPFFSLSAGSFLSQLSDILLYWVLTLSVSRWKRL